MKYATTLLKILAALAAIAGVIYVIATYGDRMVRWARKTLSRKNDYDFDFDCDCDDDCDVCLFDDDDETIVAEENDFE